MTRSGGDALRRELLQLRKQQADAARREALLASAETAGRLGTWELRPGGQLTWSDNLYRLYGYEPGDVAPSPDVVFALTHPRDRPRVERTVKILLETGAVAGPLEYRVCLPGLGVRHLRATLALTERRSGRPERLIGSVFDFTEQRTAERAIATHLAVAESLARWTAFDEGAERLLRNLAAAIEIEAGLLWVVREDRLYLRAAWCSPAVAVGAFGSATACGELTARAFRGARPVIAASPAPRDSAGSELRTVVAFPATADGEALAVLEFCSLEEAPLPDGLERSLAGVGAEIGRFLRGRRGDFGVTRLTPREREVLGLAACGVTARGIAEQLTVAPATVKTHLEHIYAKLHVGDRAAAVAAALRLGLID
jgi:DNA-binding CsgD family transcriptional regulator